jgi:hypothetical protein
MPLFATHMVNLMRCRQMQQSQREREREEKRKRYVIVLTIRHPHNFLFSFLHRLDDEYDRLESLLQEDNQRAADRALAQFLVPDSNHEVIPHFNLLCLYQLSSFCVSLM